MGHFGVYTTLSYQEYSVEGDQDLSLGQVQVYTTFFFQIHEKT